MTSNTAPVAPGKRRVSSTPYARRLARERGIAVTALAGTGPDGRVTGDDVLRFVPQTGAPVVPAAEPARVALATPAALAATVDLAAVRALMRDFADVAPSVEIVDVCLKAAATALRLTPDFGAVAGGGAQPGDTAIVLRAGKVTQALRGLDRLTLSAIVALRKDDTAASPSDERAALAITWIGRAGVRPVAMPIAAGGAARLVVAADAATGVAECLLTYDPDRIDDTAAADFLLAFKTCMEIPLRLIA